MLRVNLHFFHLITISLPKLLFLLSPVYSNLEDLTACIKLNSQLAVGVDRSFIVTSSEDQNIWYTISIPSKQHLV